MIPFNKPFLTGDEIKYIEDAVSTGHISGNGKYTKMCQRFFEERLGAKKALLTTSCTDALEMCALLLDIQTGDEVIVPSYTFVSSALAFVREGATIVFADSRSDHPGVDESSIESLITSNTKAIVVVHYAGVACDMDVIMGLSLRYNIPVIEDAAQAIESYYTGRDGVKRALGSIGHLAAFSFHETKNIQCGEGGLLAINDEQYLKRAEIIWEKGTNRAEFFRGDVNKYGWVDVGSSFLPSEISAAFLWAQLEHIDRIQDVRKKLWTLYYNELSEWSNDIGIKLPYLPDHSTNNGHMFYLSCVDIKERSALIQHMKSKDIMAVFHYLSLHSSKYYQERYHGNALPFSDNYTDCLIRLPLYVDLDEQSISKIVNSVKHFIKKK